MTAIRDEVEADIKHNFAVFGKDVYNKYMDYSLSIITTGEFINYCEKRYNEIRNSNMLRRKE